MLLTEFLNKSYGRIDKIAKFKYFKKYVKPTATRVIDLEDGDKVDAIYDEADRLSQQYADEDYSFDDNDEDYPHYEEDLVDLED